MNDRALELAAASLTILDSLLLLLKEREILSMDEISGLMEDAGNAHRGAAAMQDPEFHRNVARLIDMLGKTEDSVSLLRDIGNNKAG